MRSRGRCRKISIHLRIEEIMVLQITPEDKHTQKRLERSS
jgi:hypothetical protein